MPGDKVIAIHQPNFFPWLGYFNKMGRADLFLVMDNVQFPKTGGTWMNRVRLIVNGRPAWVTMPIVRAYRGVRMVREMQIENSTPWRPRVLNAIRESYGGAPYFETVFPLLTELMNNPTDCLAEFNVVAVRTLAEALGFDPTKLILGSSLNVGRRSTDLLVEMVKAVEGTAYLCGDGAEGYQEDAKFSAAGLRLLYQQFQHPVYRQANLETFTPGLSIIDALMNCGVEQTRALIMEHSPSVC